ncbi:hypothetical protein BCY86_02645 [Pajaroellobacter abortibovis]|uniref:PDZ domain-containing protein n=1 Tax=Pajaroellobacter abortibovis TaxID=1882918 RepID=A0A1L6MZB0_9BACT|nr:hypothetical protein BCY86_02645 [Pajaroellobacter abortibovis]
MASGSTEGQCTVNFVPIVRRADVSVVTIYTEGEEKEPLPLFFPYRIPRRPLKGLGSGFVLERKGLILTNNHVIEGADDIWVTLSDKISDGFKIPAKVVGRDPETDIAVIRITANDLTPVELGDSDLVEPGEWVVAIGNPFGLSHTVSVGIVSAVGRTGTDISLDSGYYNFIQTDAAINPGNSGGPLYNLSGQVVGINTAIRGGGAQGIGFVIPINMVKQLLPMLLRDGYVTRSELGIWVIEAQKLNPEDRKELNLVDSKAIVVGSVSPSGPADKGGVMPGDVILKFDGVSIKNESHLQWLASTAGVGKTVTLHVSRKGKTFDLQVTLGQMNKGKRRIFRG